MIYFVIYFISVYIILFRLYVNRLLIFEYKDDSNTDTFNYFVSIIISIIISLTPVINTLYILHLLIRILLRFFHKIKRISNGNSIKLSKFFKSIKNSKLK